MTGLPLPLLLDESLPAGLVLLRGFAQDFQLTDAIREVIEQSPLRYMQTRTGRMSVAMSNCGDLGWISDRSGYRYEDRDPVTMRPWPTIPPNIFDLAQRAAQAAGCENFSPDACLINVYAPSAKMGFHQDRDERRLEHPIVSVSLGLSARFAFKLDGTRNGPSRAFDLHDGDVVVMSGAARLAFHGITRVYPGRHEIWGEQRINLTLRRAA